MSYVTVIFSTYKQHLIKTIVITKLVGVLYPGYHGSLVTTQKSGYNRFPPVVNDWGIKHHIPDTVPPLLAEDEGPPT
jgi:hypothetical protein